MVPPACITGNRSARNPRRIKRLINGFGLESSLNPVWAEFTPEVVLRTLLLQHLYPVFYRDLVSYDGGYSDSAQEFVDYRVARRVLEGAAEAVGEHEWETMVTAVAGHGLAAPDRGEPDSWDGVLTRLEENLPTYFPELSRDQSFVHLLEEVMRLPRFAELIPRLRRGDTAPVSLPSTDDGPQAPSDTGAVPDRPDYQGMTVLRVDDHPGNNVGLADVLRSRGATVLVAEDRRAATRALTTGPVDLLISDIQRGTDRDAGFTALST